MGNQDLEFNLKRFSLNNIISQGFANALFGVPVVIIAIIYLGFSPLIAIIVTILYLIISIAIYSTSFYLLPPIIFEHDVELINNAVESEKVENIQRIIERLFRLPTYNAIITSIWGYTGFIIGVIFLNLGYIPELVNLKYIINLVGLTIGASVSIIQGFTAYTLNYSFIQKYIGLLIHKFPRINNDSPIWPKTKLQVQVFLIVLLPMLGAQISLMSIFLSKVYMMSNDDFQTSIGYLILLLLFSLVFTYIITQIYTNNIQAPINKLVDWMKHIIQGTPTDSIDITTNDEISDLITYSTQMVEKLNSERENIELEKDKLDTILSLIDDGVIALNEQFKVVLCNKAATMLYETDETGLINQNITNLGVLKDSSQLVNWDDVIELSVNHTETIYSLLHHDKVNYIKIFVKELANNPNDFKWLVIMQNVTERQELELMKLDFVSVAAHELRTPITSLRGYLSILDQESKTKLSSEEQTFLQRALISSNELSDLVENLLSVAKIERGALKLNISEIDIPKLIKEEITRQKNIALQKEIQIVVKDTKIDDTKAKGDIFWVSQVIMNLINNAIKYTHNCGKVEISVEHIGEFIKVIITDDGQGIPKEALPYMFEKFFRVSGVLEQGSKGSGLGLFISKSIINQNGGEIGVESEYGKGSTFWFTLPISS